MKEKSKLETIANALENGSLNRFEAERLGDHCLNTTVSILRNDYGWSIEGIWEKAPTRFGKRVKVKRYRAIDVPQSWTQKKDLQKASLN